MSQAFPSLQPVDEVLLHRRAAGRRCRPGPYAEIQHAYGYRDFADTDGPLEPAQVPRLRRGVQRARQLDRPACAFAYRQPVGLRQCGVQRVQLGAQIGRYPFGCLAGPCGGSSPTIYSETWTIRPSRPHWLVPKPSDSPSKQIR